MNERELDPAEGSGEVSRDFDGPGAGPKHAKPTVAARFIAVLAFLLVSAFVEASDSAAEPGAVQPAALEVWPAGTRLLIPNRVMKEYREVSESWTYPSVYLFANHFITAPSVRDRKKETAYIPLVRETAGKAEGKEVMTDIMNIRRSSDDRSVFVTTGEIHVISMNVYGRELYVGARVDD